MKKNYLFRNFLLCLMTWFLLIGIGYGQKSLLIKGKICHFEGQNVDPTSILITLGDDEFYLEGIEKNNQFKNPLDIKSESILFRIETPFRKKLYFKVVAKSERSNWQTISRGEFYKEFSEEIYLPLHVFQVEGNTIKIVISEEKINDNCDISYPRIFQAKICVPIRCKSCPRDLRGRVINPPSNPKLSSASKNIQNLDSFTIVPNPNYGNTKLYFNLEKNELVEIVIFDSIGRLVWTKSNHFIQGSNFLTINNLPIGLYHVVVKSESTSKTLKMVVNNQ